MSVNVQHILRTHLQCAVCLFFLKEIEDNPLDWQLPTALRVKLLLFSQQYFAHQRKNFQMVFPQFFIHFPLDLFYHFLLFFIPLKFYCIPHFNHWHIRFCPDSLLFYFNVVQGSHEIFYIIFLIKKNTFTHKIDDFVPEKSI